MPDLCVEIQRCGYLTKTYVTDRYRLVRWAERQQFRGEPALPSMWGTSADKLELYLALFGYTGAHHILTFDDEHLPQDFSEVKRCLSAFLKRARRFGAMLDRYVYAIEAGHSRGRWHIHLVVDDLDLPCVAVGFLWDYGFVNPGYRDFPVLARDGGYRRLAEYFCKDNTQMIPLGKHRWGVARGMRRMIPPRIVGVRQRAPAIPRETFWRMERHAPEVSINGQSSGRHDYASWIALPPRGTPSFLCPREAF